MIIIKVVAEMSFRDIYDHHAVIIFICSCYAFMFVMKEEDKEIMLFSLWFLAENANIVINGKDIASKITYFSIRTEMQQRYQSQRWIKNEKQAGSGIAYKFADISRLVLHSIV